MPTAHHMDVDQDRAAPYAQYIIYTTPYAQYLFLSQESEVLCFVLIYVWCAYIYIYVYNIVYVLYYT